MYTLPPLKLNKTRAQFGGVFVPVSILAGY